MSLNDPQWGNRGSNNDDGGGKRPNQGPPDLEEMWRDLNQRLSGMLGNVAKGAETTVIVAVAIVRQLRSIPSFSVVALVCCYRSFCWFG